MAMVIETLFFLPSLFLFSLLSVLSLLPGVNALDVTNEFLGILRQMRDHLKPPLPPAYMSAAIILGIIFGTSLLARLAAAWGLLATWARTIVPGQLAHSRCRWILECLAIIVLWVEGLIWPFKLENWETRARTAEAALALSRGETATAQAALVLARLETAAVRAELAAAVQEERHRRATMDIQLRRLRELFGRLQEAMA
ncbi:hypothetical protein IAQ61_003274 [Plenodomus lingam]|uniref:uncharacterized protein n=1 Tax=Leptosphaeria maculans TaxID=5022 RepID=UPI003333F0F3|nr:hypothetical protein IAQ61_003274 [Plenodomus lingam]